MGNDDVHIINVEDDPAVRILTSSYLKRAGYRVSEAATASGFYTIYDQSGVDMVLLDLNLPDDDGMEVARRLRRHSNVPVIMVTARDGDRDRIEGLELGADDYVTKPFHPRELVARVRNLLARAGGKTPENVEEALSSRHAYTFAGLTLNLAEHRLINCDGEEIPLTRGEIDLLAALLKGEGRVLSRDQLIGAVSRRGDPPSGRTIDVLVSRVRAKLKKGADSAVSVVTVQGEGYRLER